MRVIEIKTVDGSRFEFPVDRYATDPKVRINLGEVTFLRKATEEAIESDRSYIKFVKRDGSKRFYFQKNNIAYIVEKDTEEG